MNKNVITMVEIAVFAALSIALSFVKLFTLANGGSISLAMLPILVIAIRRGALAGATTGLTYAVVNCLIDGYGFTYFPLDYLIPSIAMAIVGFKFFSRNSYLVIVGALLAFAVALASHTLSGMIYWETPLWGSITYNATYVIPNAVICTSLIFGLTGRRDVIFFGIEE